MNTGNNDVEKILNKIREQAIREFAEKLKEQAVECFVDLGYGKACFNTVVVEAMEIDKLVRKMFGNPEQVKGEENG